MKHLAAAVVLLVLTASLSVAQTTGITNSAHNFSSQTWNTSGEICVTCHTPHNANTSVSDAPLWNHALSTQTYTLYSSSTLNATTGQPGGRSKLCLSCHDGTVALANFGGTTTGTTMISGGSNLGTSLSDDHPIGITYNATLASADGGLHNPVTKATSIGNVSGTVSSQMLFGTNHDQVECSSCHDVHNKYGYSHMTLMSNAASAMCLTCHNK